MSPEPGERRWFATAVVALMALQAGLTLLPIRSLDPGYDEVAHVGAAYYLAREGADDLNREHPTLAKRLAALGLVSVGAHRVDMSGVPMDQWSIGTRLIYHTPAGSEALQAARLPFLGVALLATIVIAAWTRALAGTVPALAATATFALGAVAHAHGGLVLTDLLLGLASLAACAACWWWWERGTPLAAALAGLFAALALHAKYPGVLTAAVAASLVIAAAVASPALQGRRRTLGVFGFVAASVVVFLALLDARGMDAYAAGFALLGHNHAPGYVHYALGEGYRGSWWGYFPLTLLVKSPPADLAGALLLVPVSIILARRKRVSAALALALFPLAYLAALMAGAPNFGHRYTVPLYGFFAIATGLAVAELGPRLRGLAFGAVLATQLSTAALASPDPLSYFNGLLGCRGASAWKCLDDSNIEWGQNHARVEAELARRGVAKERLVVDLSLNSAPEVRFAGARTAGWSTWFAPGRDFHVVSAQMLVRRLLVAPELRRSALYAELGRAEYFGGHFLVDLRARYEAAATRIAAQAPH